MKKNALLLMFCSFLFACNDNGSKKGFHTTASNKSDTVASAPDYYDDSISNAAVVDTTYDGHHLLLQRNRSKETDTLILYVDNIIQEVLLGSAFSATKCRVLQIYDGKRVYYSNFCKIGDTMIVLGFADTYYRYSCTLFYKIQKNKLIDMYPDEYYAPYGPPSVFIDIKKHAIFYMGKLEFKNHKDLTVPYREVCINDLITDKSDCKNFYTDKMPVADPDRSEEEFDIAQTEYYIYVDKHFYNRHHGK